MPDVFTKAKRSDVMSRIRSRGNADTELALAKLLRRHRITGWRRQQPVFGRPDFVSQKLKLAVFVDGCFWHGCPKHGTQPKGNRTFWKNKFARNRARDVLVTRTLRRAGWQVLRVWEHELRQSGKRKAESGKIKPSTPHPGPLPVRGGEGVRKRRAERGTPPVVRRIQRALGGRSRA